MYDAFEEDLDFGSQCRTIAVTSGKGGVGKSSLVANLALSLGARGKQVIVFDADLGMANLDVIFGVRPRFTLYHVVEGRKNLLDIVTSVNDKVKLFAGGSGLSNLADLDDSIRGSILEALAKIRQYADILLIDTGAGLSSNVIGFLQYADEVLLVSTPEPTSMADAYGIIKTLAKSPDPFPSVSVVVNRAASSMEAFGVSSRLTTVARKFLEAEIQYKGFILEDELVSKAVRSQTPFTQLYPDSKASLCIQKLADSFGGVKQAPIAAKKHGFLGGLMSLFARGR
jgi:flagellar biosynthesis protein FlhG